MVKTLECKIAKGLCEASFSDFLSELSRGVPLDRRLSCALGIAENLVRRDKQLRAQKWKEALEAPDGDLLAKHLRGFRQLPITMLEEGGDDGSKVADPYQVARVISQHWKDFHNPVQPPEIDYPTLDAFLGKGEGTPFPLSPVTPEEVEVSIASLRAKTATGPDGWRAVDVKKLPKAFAQDLAVFFGALEKADSWPDLMRRAWLTPVPKSDQRVAADTRPVAIFGVWYRLWSATRSRALRSWMELILAPEQSAYRAHRSAEREALRFDR